MKQNNTLFEQAFQNLNAAQKKAVETIEGPVFVLAGPGTGKTQVLTTRIAHILKETDTDPSSILALTFTDAATKEMRERLIKMIGPDGYYVKISTFHGFCNDIIMDNPDRFSRPAGMQAVTDLERHQYVNEILEKGEFEYLKTLNNPLFYTKDIIAAISNLKREGFTIQKYQELLQTEKDQFEIDKEELSKTAFKEREKLLNKNFDLLEIYQQYQQKLVDSGRFDFDDMINWVVDAFETDSDFLLEYQEQYEYFLVDEYQDTNSSQNNLVFLLSSYWGERANVFAVGDMDQSIMRFQGASKENIYEFQKRFPNLSEIVLDQNYRSTANILMAAATLLGKERLQDNVSFKNQKIKVAEFSTPIFEDNFIAKSIKNKIKKGISWSEIAVIVKENKDIEELIPIFKQEGIPYRVQGENNILLTPYVIQFVKLLKVVTNLQGRLEDIDLFTVLGYPYFQIKPLSLLKAARSAHQHHQALADLLLHDQPDMDDQLVSVFNKLVSWNSKIATHTLTEIFQIMFQESGLQNYLLSLPRAITELNRFTSFFEEVKNQANSYVGIDLFGFVQNLEVMLQNDLKLKEKNFVSMEEAVTLTTAHKAKGLEWNVVYIYRFADTHWGNKTRRQNLKLPKGIINYEDLEKEEDKNSEEKRLFYVALTRAKSQIYLTGAREYPNSAKMIFPAIFIHDLPQATIKKLKTTGFESKAVSILKNYLSPPLTILANDDESQYLREIIKDTRLSPTSLNTFLECAYKYKLDHLYKLPKAKAPAMCFGTAVHYALEQLYLTLNNGQKAEKESFLKDFESALRQEVLTESEFKQRLKHGVEVLSAYFDFHREDFVSSLYTEKSFGRALTAPVVLDDIALDGKVDRIDLVDKDKKLVRVVDYKTGEPKSRNEIEGVNKNADGNYKRQLVFYHLLSELDHTFGYHVIQSEIDFVEPNDSGIFKTERFNITVEEIEDLKKVIRLAAKQIRGLDFAKTTDSKKCQNCPFKDHCWPEGLVEKPV